MLLKAWSTLNAEFVVLLIDKRRIGVNGNIWRLCMFQMESWPVIPVVLVYINKLIFVVLTITVIYKSEIVHRHLLVCALFSE